METKNEGAWVIPPPPEDAASLARRLVGAAGRRAVAGVEKAFIDAINERDKWWFDQSKFGVIR